MLLLLLPVARLGMVSEAGCSLVTWGHHRAWGPHSSLGCMSPRGCCKGCGSAWPSASLLFLPGCLLRVQDVPRTVPTSPAPRHCLGPQPVALHQGCKEKHFH